MQLTISNSKCCVSFQPFRTPRIPGTVAVPLWEHCPVYLWSFHHRPTPESWPLALLPQTACASPPHQLPVPGLSVVPLLTTSSPQWRGQHLCRHLHLRDTAPPASRGHPEPEGHVRPEWLSGGPGRNGELGEQDSGTPGEAGAPRQRGALLRDH